MTHGTPQSQGRVTDREATELSGIAASRARPGLWWVHNDSGDTARVFVLSAGGAVVAEVALTGATAEDWEDIAVAPCGAQSCVYVGDIGDNDERRASVTVYRFREDEVLAALREGERVETRVRPDRMVLRYPDRAHNSEALVVLPENEQVAVVTKVMSGAVEVFRAPPFAADSSAVMVRVGVLRIPSGNNLVTGADWHPCEPRLLVRTYDRLWEYASPTSEGDTLASASAVEPVRRSVAAEGQGEAVGWAFNGRGYATVSEGRNQNLWRTFCVE